MSDQTEFLPYEEARKIVARVMEEEHLQDPDRRVLTVYDLQDRELCWFDADELIAELGLDPKKPETREAAVEYIFHHIPRWAVEQYDNDSTA